MRKRLAFIGAGSHADAVFLILDKNRYKLVGYFDDKDINEHDGFPVLGKIDDVEGFLKSGKIDSVFVTIGDNEKRQEVFDTLCPEFYNSFINIISPTAIVLSKESIQGRGIFIGSGAFVGAKVSIADNTIVNTNSVVEHHTKIGSHVNIAPSVTINGICNIHDGCYLGSSSVLIQLIDVCPNTVIGAGAVVVKSIGQRGTYIGVPAKILNKENV